MTTPAVTDPTPATPAPVVAPPAAAPSEAERQASFNENILNRLVEAEGGGNAGLRRVALNMVQERGKLLRKVTRLRDQVAGDEDVVLKADAAAVYKRYQALNLTPEQITELKTQRDTLDAKVKASERAQLFETVADTLRLPSKKGRSAFAKLAEKDGIQIELRDVIVKDSDGVEKTEKKAFGRIGMTGEYTALDELLEKDYGEFLPALYAEDDAGDATSDRRTGDSGSGRPHAPSGLKVTPMATQGGSSRASGGSDIRGAAERVINQRYAARAKPA